MADVLNVTDTLGVALRSALQAHGRPSVGDRDPLIGFCLPCDVCGEWVEAEASASFLDQHGVLCDGHQCLNA